jgi:pimeloyl-ACP methyl ester carboxylesterase
MTRLDHYERDGLTFDVRDEGPEEGDPVVLLHGFPERSTCWAFVAPLLHEEGLRTYAPDQRGYSPRARPPHRGDYRTQELVGDVVALLEEIGEPVHLVGHDWGSAVGWLVAAQHPDLVRTWTAVSVPHPASFMRALATPQQALRSWYMAAFQLPWLPEGLAQTPLFDRWLRGSGMTEGDVARFRTEMVEDGAFHYALMWYRAMLFPERQKVPTRVRVPTTFVWSDGDLAVSRAAEQGNEKLVEAPYRYVELSGVSHWIPTEAPEALAEAVLDRIRSVE